MPHTLFISDLHLSPARPEAGRLFFAFLRDVAPAAESLYILGDLFEYWAGDDDADAPFNAAILGALSGLAARSTRVRLMHGNRDFLLGRDAIARAGALLVTEPAQIDLHGTATVLMHGDTLCTADTDYQSFRVRVRDEAWQAAFLARPLSDRHAEIAALRTGSESMKQRKAMAIMDATPEAVEAAFRSSGCQRMIHGHTHRPARHLHRVDGRDCERIVLGDWYDTGSYLRCDARGCASIAL